jgi:hypothetical protein
MAAGLLLRLYFYFSRWQKMLGQLLFVLPVEAATVAPGWS